jgi:transposase
MIQITAQMRILVAVGAFDFRCGIDGLARLCREHLDADPFCGAVFVFTNRRRTAIKALTYDGQGFWAFHKRLSSGHFRFWPEEGVAETLQAHELQVLLMGGNPRLARGAPAWRALAAPEPKRVESIASARAS